MKKKILVLLLAATSGIFAQSSIQLLKDVNVGAGSSYTESGDGFIGHVGGKVLLQHTDTSNYAPQLIVSDGTPSGTLVLFDTLQPFQRIEQVVAINTSLTAFVITDNSAGFVCITDGTKNGTKVLSSTVKPYSRVSNLSSQDGFVYYRSYNQVYKVDPLNDQSELAFESFNNISNYFIDGENLYTIFYEYSLSKDVFLKTNLTTKTADTLGLFEGLDITGDAHFTKLGNKIVFFCYYFDDNQLWVTEGTKASTKFLRSFATSGYGVDNYLVFNGKLFFTANLPYGDPAYRGYEVYTTDGTEAGTFSVYNDAKSYDYASELTVFNNRLYFQASVNYEYKLLSTDGNINDIKVEFEGTSDSFYTGDWYLAADKNYVYFVATSTTDSKGYEIYGFDGNSVKVFESQVGSGDLSPESLFSYNDKLYLFAREDATGKELYVLNNIVNGVDEQNDINIAVFPNPANDVLNVEIKENVLGYQLLDVDGNEIASATLNSNKIDVSSLSSGIYILKLLNENKTQVVKFVKK